MGEIYESRNFSACSTAAGDLETSGQPEIWPVQLMCFRNYESRTIRKNVENKFLVKPKNMIFFGLTEKSSRTKGLGSWWGSPSASLFQ